MTRTMSPTVRRLTRAAGLLAAPAMCGLGVWTGAPVVSAQAITSTVGAPATSVRADLAPAAARGLPAPTPIPLDTPAWSGRAGFGSRRPAWYTDDSGIVHLQGAVRRISGPDLIGTLPKAARPAHIVALVVHTFDGTYGVLAIEPDGRMFVSGPPFPALTNLKFVSLESITYRPAGSGNPIAVNGHNWSSVSAFGRAAWFTDKFGVVHLQGAVRQVSSSGAGANLIGTLPRRARPARTVYTIVVTTGGYADLAIEPDGSIAVIDPRPPASKEYDLVSLESISFRPGLLHRQIKVNSVNWTGSAGFDSRRPGWYADRNGIIHLQGAVHQISNFGAAANLIGTLPPAARPSHTVYTIVHTFDGTYADLAIEPNGDLELINPSVPLVTDFSFVSLESITYRR